MRPVRGPRVWGRVAALLWCLACVAWFDVAAAWRPGWLAVIPPLALVGAAIVAVGAWLGEQAHLWPPPEAGARATRRAALLLVLALTFLFRLPMAWQGAAGYLTADGALSGIVALHLRDGSEHLVFVPQVAYSGSLKSHLTALLAFGVDPARAFALCSVGFYCAFVAAVFRLGVLAAPARTWVATAAGVYLAFAPAFLTRYSLSNDGNYVEVLALGTWALVLAVRFAHAEKTGRSLWALLMGLLLGLAFWSHVLAMIYVLTVVVAVVWFARKDAVPCLWRLAVGGVLGAFPSVLWNISNGFATLLYLVPGGAPGSGEGPGLLEKGLQLFMDHAPILAGYDLGYGRWVSALLAGGASLALLLMAWAVWKAYGEARATSDPARSLLLLFVAVNLAMAWLALPYIPGNPRYLQFALGPLAVLLALALEGRRALMAALVAFGALGSLAQAPGAFRSDRQWRAFVSDLQREEVRFCYSDFYLATKVNFLSGEAVVCSAKLGPTTTEYFLDYRERVDRAPAAAYVAVNPTAAFKLERRLDRLGVRYERRELMKPVLLRLSRKVDPAELFPDRSFPVR